ncbi:unnamed protein product [Dibothriocephalus latus]|uniref:Uncharacterized protein n=1 Tax=Dibothriocephalus latus TaxID=60516 RepID=A0A3P7MVN2_DIBLA|nr:unnamed protein product [Dibothriocephalus latus]
MIDILCDHEELVLNDITPSLSEKKSIVQTAYIPSLLSYISVRTTAQ